MAANANAPLGHAKAGRKRVAARKKVDNGAPKKMSKKSSKMVMNGTAPKKRKESNSGLMSRTYYRRKEEMKQLERQLYGMTMQLQHLARQKEVADRHQVIEARRRENLELRECIRGQRVIFANTDSMISEFLRGPDHSLYEPMITLGTDPRDRYETLMAMKQQRLDEAVAFLSERSRYMSMDTEFTDLRRYQAEGGDVCLVCFDVKPFRKAQSVKQAFDGVLQFSYNMEISISELIGDITVRENEDTDWDSSIAQHRLVTSVTPDVKVDTNNVTFRQYWSGGSGPHVDRTVGGELGLAVCNYVAEDALYPYHSSERVRQDITFFIMIARYPRRSRTNAVSSPLGSSASSMSSHEEDDGIVVATRWTCLRLRQPPFPLDEDMASHIRDGMEMIGQAMFTAIRHSIGARPTGRDHRES